ncbi:riboflavin kinase [Globomyces sp. JEL0801]|nr:riboflavin kinase [Globomyces sp. JEL0801]
MTLKGRPSIVGPDVPTSPYPLRLKGTVTKGFGRGSKELGIPTANLPETVSGSVEDVLETGIYYGFAGVGTSSAVYPMEVHIIHKFEADFYDEELRIIILGYLRPELDYTTKDALIEDINIDIQVATNSMERISYQKFTHDPFFQV